MLKQYRFDPSQIVLVEEIEEKPIGILDRDVNVLWRNHGTKEATWEPEDSIHQQYPYLFEFSNFEDKISFRGREIFY
ncbi:receptor-like protein kinase [Gossypium australe]|uniref:Receptor-like protein kinase n=1 Tax=Gossypium australe TaxID=47621 RepID=A0A5B6VIE1_9ROSI|nr:receptor-like protein kinase [Gossypium australe]